jgi:hypothetical protein
MRHHSRVTFAHGARGRLTARDLGRFPAETLFDRIGRAVCAAGCLPRKELYEAWEVGKRARRLFRGGRVVDLGAGHGLLAHIMLILDDTSPLAVVVDHAPPPCGAAIDAVLTTMWARLAGRVTRVTADLDRVELGSDDVVVASHACGRLSDIVIDRAAAAGARLAVLPCCHDLKACDAAGLDGWMDHELAIDAARAVRLRDRGYRTWTQTIPETITPKNRLLLAAPRPSGVSD